MMRLLSLVVPLAVLVACAHSPRSQTSDSSVRASYVWGPEVNTMKPCGSDSTFWVLASQGIIGRLRAAHDSLRTGPYDRIYITVHGHRSPKPTDGFAEQTNGYFEVTEILEVRRLRQGECV